MPGRWATTVVVIGLLAVLFKGFMVKQILLRGDAYLSYTMHDDAIREYQKALLLDPASDWAYVWLGHAYQGIGDREKAMETYAKAVAVDPQNRTALIDAGVLLMKERRAAEAEAWFLKAAMIPPRDDEDEQELVEALMWLSRCQRALGELDEARRTCREILRVRPENASVRSMLDDLAPAARDEQENDGDRTLTTPNTEPAPTSSAMIPHA